ncbi:probable pectate lyase 4 [Cryptomeria japonica]|uniref:probable pectate lyase 4 n=1 Tax=Cryptomeria japonica TaxID=3369 RepID=UPI0027DA783C|nr:probable pectate lyase 4 [Cryptomeria japonica]
MENTTMYLVMAVFIFGYIVAGSAMHDHGHAAGDKYLKNESVSFVGSLRVRKNGPMPWVGTTGRLCKRSDGTKCQFSSCGLGRLLPKCAIGFARGVKGGRKGLSYTVTRSDDNPTNPALGTLRYAVSLYSASPRGVWITFSHDMKIQLKQMLHVYNRTTIDGRGVRVIITGYSIELNKVQDVILHNLQVSDINSDTVHIFESKMVWVDHLTSFNGQRGLVSAV